MAPFRYIAVDWHHSHPEEPVRLYSELDPTGCEKRKVEEFRDGRKSFSDSVTHSGATRLGEEPLPDLANIAKDRQFIPVEIAKDEFERIWNEAIRE